MAPEARIDVVLVNWNSGQDAKRLMDSLEAQTLLPADVVVVDNGSRDGSGEWLGRQPGVRLINNQHNLGFAVAANQGIAAGSSPLVLLCNLDVTLDGHFLERAAARMGSLPRIGSVGGKLLRAEPPAGQPATIDSTGHLLFRSGWVVNRGEGEEDRGQYDRAEEVFGVSAAAALYRREMLQDVALRGEVFCPDFFAYLEDVDLDWRARWRAWRSWYEPEAVAIHRRGGTGLHRTAAIERCVLANRISVWRRDSPRAWRDPPGSVPQVALLALRSALAAYRHPSAISALLDAWRRGGRDRSARRGIQQRSLVTDRSLTVWAKPTPLSRLVRSRWRS